MWKTSTNGVDSNDPLNNLDPSGHFAVSMNAVGGFGGGRRTWTLTTTNWNRVRTRLSIQGYTGTDIQMVAAFRSMNRITETGVLRGGSITYNRIFSNNAVHAVRTDGNQIQLRNNNPTAPQPQWTSSGVMAAPPQSQPTQARPPTPTTPNNNRPTTNQQNSGTAQNNTPPRCPQMAEAGDRCGDYVLIGGEWFNPSTVEWEMSIGIVPFINPSKAVLKQLIVLLGVTLLGLFVIGNADVITRDASNAFNWNQATTTQFDRLLRGAMASAIGDVLDWDWLGSGSNTGDSGAGNPSDLGNVIGGLSINFVMTEAMFRARTDQVELERVRTRLKFGKFYPAMTTSRFSPLMVIPVPIKNNSLAKRTMLALGPVPGGVYTINKASAKRIVQSVSPGGKKVVHEAGHGIGHFPHYHPYNRIPKTHAWYGAPRFF